MCRGAIRFVGINKSMQYVFRLNDTISQDLFDRKVLERLFDILAFNCRFHGQKACDICRNISPISIREFAGEMFEIGTRLWVRGFDIGHCFREPFNTKRCFSYAMGDAFLVFHTRFPTSARYSGHNIKQGYAYRARSAGDRNANMHESPKGASKSTDTPL